MKLKDVEMVVGTCISNDDPEKLGRIKVAAPGYFDRSIMAIDSIPWVYPLTMPGYQVCSTITEGGKVWLIDNKTNADEFWYIPFYELNNDTKEALGNDVDTNIVFSRNSGGKLVQLYQNDNDGIVMKSGDTAVTVSHDGSCKMVSNDVGVVIEGGTVYCGKKDEEKIQMVRGDTLTKIVNIIKDSFTSLKEACLESPYTEPLVPHFRKGIDDINENINELLSDSCSLSK